MAKHEGIRARQKPACPARGGGHCRCTPGYRASLWSNRDRQVIRRTFPSLAAAKAWRADAQRDLRQGRLRVADPPDRPPGRRGMDRGRPHRRGRDAPGAPTSLTLRGYEHRSREDRSSPRSAPIGSQTSAASRCRRSPTPSGPRGSPRPRSAISSTRCARSIGGRSTESWSAINPTTGARAALIRGAARPDRRPRRGRGAARGAPGRRPGPMGDRLLCGVATRRTAGAPLVGYRPRPLGDQGRAVMGSRGGRGRAEIGRRAPGPCRCSPCSAISSMSTSWASGRGGSRSRLRPHRPRPIRALNDPDPRTRRMEAAGLQPITLHECLPHLRLADDRGGREPEGDSDIHGPRHDPDDLRSLRPSDAREPRSGPSADGRISGRFPHRFPHGPPRSDPQKHRYEHAD